jgi:hypothetical protein
MRPHLTIGCRSRQWSISPASRRQFESMEGEDVAGKDHHQMEFEGIHRGSCLVGRTMYNLSRLYVAIRSCE